LMELPIGLVTKFSAPLHTATLLAPPPPPHTVLCSFVLCSHSHRRRVTAHCVHTQTLPPPHTAFTLLPPPPPRCAHTPTAATATVTYTAYTATPLAPPTPLHRLHCLHCLHRLHRLHPPPNPILLDILPHPRPHTSTPGQGAGVRPPSNKCVIAKLAGASPPPSYDWRIGWRRRRRQVASAES
jgi:hypothetical protein